MKWPSKTHSWITLLLIAVACISFFHHFPNPRLITFDVYGYYSYLPAAFTYQDLSEFAFTEDHFTDYNLGSGNYQVTTIDSHRIPIYTMGLAMLVSPFYVLAEITARLTGSARDGLSLPYQFFFWLSSIFYMFLGFWYLRKWLEKFVSGKSVVFTILTLVLATNYFVYATFENGLTHAFIFSMYAILLYVTSKWIEQPTLKNSLQLSFIITLLCLIRPSELIAALIPGLLVLQSIRKGQIKWAAVLKYLPAMIGLGILLVLPQILLWKQNTGQWIFNAYTEGGHAFEWLHPHIWDGLFSFRKGWLIYTPVMLMIIPGFFLVWHHAKSWFWPILVYLTLHIYITMSWDMWWYASSFSSRPMIHTYGVLALPLALTFQHIKKWYWLLATFVILTGALNLFQIWQLNKKILPWDGISQTFYWKVFGKTKVDKSTIKYVDLEESLKVDRNHKWDSLQTLILNDSSLLAHPEDLKKIQGRLCQEVAPTREFSQPLVYHLNGAKDSSPGKKWLKAEAEVLRKGDRFSAYSIAEFGTTFHHDDKIIKNEGIRFPFYVPEDEWTWIDFEVTIPSEMKSGDMIKSFIWNHSPDTIYVSEIRLKFLAKD